MNWRPIRGWTRLLHEREMKADSMPERLLIGPGSPPSLDPVYPELSPPLEPCPNLNILRAICSGHGYPTPRAANTSCPRSNRFWLLELRVARTGTKPLRGGKDEGPARRRWTSATHATHTIFSECGMGSGEWGVEFIPNSAFPIPNHTPLPSRHMSGSSGRDSMYPFAI